MKSIEYRSIIAQIVRNSLKKEYPTLKLKMIDSKEGLCYKIARAIHARMYGANVDGVDSPIWRDVGISETNPNGSGNKYASPPNLPNVDASELLKQEDEK